jgi:hypothetical protein
MILWTKSRIGFKELRTFFFFFFFSPRGIQDLYGFGLETLLFLKISTVLSFSGFFKQTTCGIKGFKVFNFIMIEDLGFLRIN